MAYAAAEVTLGPVLFNWAPETWRDFYFRVADEAPVTTVYLGEVICSKRAPLFERHVADVVERLSNAGKTVVFSTLAEVMSKIDRKLVDSICVPETPLIEVNDASALARQRGRPHHLGPFLNVYNERTLAVLARHGACHVCLPPEMPATAIRSLSANAADLGVSVEVQIFGRVGLALSARCYHARAHGRTKDNCMFVCDKDPDGMPLHTLDRTPFLAVNGIQTLSYNYLNLVGELDALWAMGVTHFRVSPHSCNMVAAATIFRSVLDRQMETEAAEARLAALDLGAPFSNGFYHGKAGHLWVQPARQ